MNGIPPIYIFYGFCLLVVVVVIRVIRGAIMDLHRRGIHRLTWRWFSGHAMDGRYYTDATWTRKATRVYHSTGQVLYWHHLPRLVRVGIRWGITVILCGELYGFLAAPGAALLGNELTGGSAVLGGSYVSWIKARKSYRRKHVFTPLARALAPKLGSNVPETTKLITIKDGYRRLKEGELGRIKLPDEFSATDAEQTAVQNLLVRRLGVPIEFEWRTDAGGGGYVQLNAAPLLPSMVKFEDYLDEIAKNKTTEYIAGILPNGKVKRLPLDGETSHHGMCFASGRGKSSYLQQSVAQLLTQDPNSHATVLDTKMGSFTEFMGLKCVTIYDDPSDMGSMVTAGYGIAKIMADRYQAQKKDKSLINTWPLELLILEEANHFSSVVKGWWLATKEKGDPPNPPFWLDVIATLLWQGRAVNVKVMCVFQNMQDRFFGNLSLRSSFGWVGMSGYKPPQWKSIVGTTYVKPQKGKGRILLTDGEEETWIQGLYAPGEWLKEYIIASRPEEKEMAS